MNDRKNYNLWNRVMTPGQPTEAARLSQIGKSWSKQQRFSPYSSPIPPLYPTHCDFASKRHKYCTRMSLPEHGITDFITEIVFDELEMIDIRQVRYGTFLFDNKALPEPSICRKEKNPDTVKREWLKIFPL